MCRKKPKEQPTPNLKVLGNYLEGKNELGEGIKGLLIKLTFLQVEFSL